MAISGAVVDLDTGNAGAELQLTSSNGAITAGTLTAGAVMTLQSSRDISFTNATAGANLDATAAGAIAFTNATGAEVRLTAGATITGGAVRATGIAAAAATTISS